jgi:hypothetical protein
LSAAEETQKPYIASDFLLPNVLSQLGFKFLPAYPCAASGGPHDRVPQLRRFEELARYRIVRRWFFGNNVEDSMGHLRYLVFYLLGGALASGAHIYMNGDSIIPTVGASGAISTVMGAYLVLYPRARIHTLFILFIIIKIFPIPAWFVLGQYLVVQLLNSSIAANPMSGGVAVWAHIGGFATGAVLVKLFENRTLVEARKQHLQISPYEVKHRGWW